MVQVDTAHSVSAQEQLGGQETQTVAVKEDLGGVHGDLSGDRVEAEDGALDHVETPGGVVVAGAQLRTAHPAVAGQEGAAPTQGEAVLGVVAQEEGGGQPSQGEWGGGGGVGGAGELPQVRDERSGGAGGGQEPVQGTVALQWVGSQQEDWGGGDVGDLQRSSR